MLHLCIIMMLERLPRIGLRGVTGRFTAKSLADTLKLDNIHCIAISPTQIRMVTHLDVHAGMVSRLVSVIDNL